MCRSNLNLHHGSSDSPFLWKSKSKNGKKWQNANRQLFQVNDKLLPYYLWMSENKMSEIIKKWNNSGKYGPHYTTSFTQKSHIMG